MKKIISIIINTQGIFSLTAMQKNSKLTSYIRKSLIYIDAEKDKENFRNDMQNIYLDFKKSVNEVNLIYKF
jgi:hypothetical protein